MRASAIPIPALLLLLATGARAQAPRDSGPNTLSSTAPAAASQSPGNTATTVSVPIHDGDPATVTGNLALQTRAGKQFLVIESPTPYRLVLPPGHLGAPRVIIRDISFTLPGQQAAIAAFAGRTVTAVGKLHIEGKAANSWNGALLEADTVILPGGRKLHAEKR